jgi:hypothetical protein
LRSLVSTLRDVGECQPHRRDVLVIDPLSALNWPRRKAITTCPQDRRCKNAGHPRFA